MAKGWFEKMLLNSGLTNSTTEDYGSIASSTNKMQYNYYCTSDKCCTVIKEEKEVYMKKNKGTQIYKSFKRKDKILKFVSTEYYSKCADCGSLLFSKRVRT